jgi:hypothetical protein
VKITKVLAVVLFMIMALTVVSGTGVLAAPKAAAQVRAQPLTPTVPTVWYKPGKTAIFLPWQYNFHVADYTIYWGTADHTEWAKWTTGYASVKGTSSSTFSWALSGVGARWELKGITPHHLVEKTCTVTMKVSYSLAAMGNGEADLFMLTGFKGNDIRSWKNYATVANVTNNVKTGTITTAHTFSLADVCYYDAATNTIYGGVASAPQSFVSPSGSARAIMTVYSITVTFN